MAKQFVYIGLLSVLLFISCSQNNHYETIISNTESIVEENPDSALAILNIFLPPPLGVLSPDNGGNRRG